MGRTALITGITGQDGSYLADFLLEKGYNVVGMTRRVSVPTLARIEHIKDNITLVEGDLLDQSSVMRVLKENNPDEVYNLAAMSFVPHSWQQPELTGQYTGLGVTRMLEAIRQQNPQTKFYQASSSEMYGKVQEVPQKETTRFYPRSPYGAAKAYGHYITVNYRESYNLFAVSGILFNHESPRRGMEFVTKKISDGVAKIATGKESKIKLGNLDAKRDWGYAGDYVEAMWLMLQQKEPQDFVIATGEHHSVKEFDEESFKVAGIDNWQAHVETDPRFMRKAEVDSLLGDSSKARQVLGWQPKVSFKELVKMMVEADIARHKQ